MVGQCNIGKVGTFEVEGKLVLKAEGVTCFVEKAAYSVCEVKRH